MVVLWGEQSLRPEGDEKVATKSRKRFFNVLMVILIAIVIVCGFMVVGNLKGWFGGNDESELICTEVTGVADMERKDVGYALEKGTLMAAGDIVETKEGSEAIFTMSGDNTISLNEKTETKIEECTGGNVNITLNSGEFMADVPKAPKSFLITFGGNKAEIKGTVFSASRHKGSSTLSVYEGSVEVKTAGGRDIEVTAGNQIQIVEKENGSIDVETIKLEADALSAFQIEKLRAAESKGLCFSKEELDSVISAREKEEKQAAKALEEKALAASGQKEEVNICTISIRCDTILKNMDKLAEGKNKYVPANGKILATSKVEFRKGETAFDVTKRACSAAGIQMEYKYTPVYGSYYVEGINHLYEFDCGKESGWTYKVNGWYPNYGSSEYSLKNGDSIVWYYTCDGGM